MKPTSFSLTHVMLFTLFAAALTMSENVPAQTMADASPTASQVALPTGTVAIVNGVAIPQARLDEAVLLSRQADTAQLRKALTSRLVAFELFRQTAEKQNYGEKPEVIQAMNVAKAKAAIRQQLQTVATEKAAADLVAEMLKNSHIQQ